MQFYNYYDLLYPALETKLLTLEISMYNHGGKFVFIFRYLREQTGNQVQLSFQNFSPENFSHHQHYNVGFLFDSVDTHVISQKEQKKNVWQNWKICMYEGQSESSWNGGMAL
jgi:hypothetical protein